MFVRLRALSGLSWRVTRTLSFNGLIDMRCFVSLIYIASLGASVGVLAFPPALHAQNYHVAYGDHDNYGYDGVKARIDVWQTIATAGVAVWCGIDDGHHGMWLQVGWLRNTGQSGPRAYYEVWNEIGEYSLSEVSNLSIGNASFELVLVGYQVEFYVNGQLVHLENWEDFDDHQMCKAQYGGETHADPGDHVPGDPTNYCVLSDIYARSVAKQSYSQASLASAFSITHSHGHRSIQGNGFAIWDDRTLFQEP